MKRYRGNTQMGSYNHLNEDDILSISLSIDKLAQQVIGMNYGVHRLLSAIAKRRLDNDPQDGLGQGVKQLLDEGWY
jgi:hypothetical protein